MTTQWGLERVSIGFQTADPLNETLRLAAVCLGAEASTKAHGDASAADPARLPRLFTFLNSGVLGDDMLHGSLSPLLSPKITSELLGPFS